MTSFFKAITAALPLVGMLSGAAGADTWRQTCAGPDYVCGKAAPAKAPVAKVSAAKPAHKVKSATAQSQPAAKTAVVLKKPTKAKIATVKNKTKAKVAHAEPQKAKPKAKVAKHKPAEKATGYQSGVASWYGGNFHGRKTANGETYDMYAMTAAHKTLPFGTRVRVTNANNGNSVVVRINDRGPFIAGRIIDLSKAAASDIGLTATGVAPVKVAILGKG